VANIELVEVYVVYVVYVVYGVDGVDVEIDVDAPSGGPRTCNAYVI
jgi:hypothetical protein